MSEKKEDNDIGFGTKTTPQRSRLINKDGSFNIERIDVSRWSSTSMYHALITMPWRKFNLIVFCYFMIVNLIFACGYYFTGVNGLNGVVAVTESDKFLEAFFFSTQTISTVGFGRINPISHLASSIAAFESLVGLLGFALATGILFARFSRPVAKIIFSKNAIIAPFNDINAFQFRIANKMRNSQITDMNCRLTVAKYEIENGVKIRRFRALELELKSIVFFPMTWTINHPIDIYSPLYGMTKKDLEEADAEFLISLNGFDDTFSQNVNSRHSYTYEEIVMGAKWISVFSLNEKGQTSQDLNKISEYETAVLNSQ